MMRWFPRHTSWNALGNSAEEKSSSTPSESLTHDHNRPSARPVQAIPVAAQLGYICNSSLNPVWRLRVSCFFTASVSAFGSPTRMTSLRARVTAV